MSNEHRYCAFCGCRRQIYLKKHVGLNDYFYALIMSLFVMWARWQALNFKFIVIFIAFVVFMEVLIQIRHRLNIMCDICGFDPVLYIRSPEKAAEVVKKQIDKVRADPNFLLSRKLEILVRRLYRRRPRKALNPPF